MSEPRFCKSPKNDDQGETILEQQAPYQNTMSMELGFSEYKYNSLPPIENTIEQLKSVQSTEEDEHPQKVTHLHTNESPSLSLSKKVEPYIKDFKVIEPIHTLQDDEESVSQNF